MSGCEQGCFQGDLSTMSLTARRLAIRLKQGRPIMALSDDGSFQDLEDHRDEVELSLNNDLLTLFVDEENGVAWAVRPIELPEGSLLSANTLHRNDLAVFISLGTFVCERRQLGYANTSGWIITSDELFQRYKATSTTYSRETRGELVANDFEAAVKRARSNYWLRDVKRGRYQVLPVVASLVDLRLVESIASQLEQRTTEGGGGNE